MLFSDQSAPDGPARDIYTDRRQGLQRSTARTAEATSLNTGGITLSGNSGLTVEGGGDITVDGGSVFVRGDGGITVQQGARIVAEYPSGSKALYFGALRSSADYSVPAGTGLLTRRSSGPLLAQIFEGADGVAIIEFDTDSFEVVATDDATVYGESLARFTSGGTAAFGGSAGTYLQPESTGLAANMHMAVDGRVFRSTSSRRYKSDIQDAAVDPDAVLRLQPRTWLPGAIPRTCPDWLHETHPGKAHCPAEQEPACPDPDARRQVGFVAEELVDLGLEDFVEFNAEGEPEAIYYDRLTAALVPLLQRQQAQIDALTQKLEQLAARVAGQEHAPEPNNRRQ